MESFQLLQADVRALNDADMVFSGQTIKANGLVRENEQV